MLGIADGWLSADGSIIYRAFDLKVGLFRDAALQAAAPDRRARREMRTGIHETGRRHGNGDRLIDRQQYPGSAAHRCARPDPALSRAEKYAELGFRCQVHGAPTLDPKD